MDSVLNEFRSSEAYKQAMTAYVRKCLQEESALTPAQEPRQPTRSTRKPKKNDDLRPSQSKVGKPRRSESVIAMEMELLRKDQEIKKLKKENAKLKQLLQ